MSLNLLAARARKNHVSAPVTTVTWNPLDKNASVTLSPNNLSGTNTGASGTWRACRATLGISAASANHYFEVVYTGTVNSIVGVTKSTMSMANGNYPGIGVAEYGYLTTGAVWSSGAPTAYGATYSAGVVIGVLVKNGKLYFSRNGVWQKSGDPIAETGFAASGLSGIYFPTVGFYDNGIVWTARFKLSEFTYAPPAGSSSWAGEVPTSTALSTWDAAKAPPLITLTSSLVAKCTSTVSYNTGGGTTPKSTGKWAFVCTLAGNNDGYMGIGASVGAGNPWIAGFKPSDAYAGRGESIGLTTFNGALRWTSQTLSSTSAGAATTGVAVGTAITVLLDLDSTPQTIKFYIGNTLKASLSLNAGLRGIAWVPLYSLLYSNQTATINTGQTTITIPTPETANGYNAYWGERV